LSMPGSPIIYYGDEIGMGDNIFLGDRNGVRTPMQWSPDRNGGFSRADPQRLFLPPIMDPVYGYESVNVEAQTRDPSSLLNWMRRLLTVRRSSRAFGRGTLDFLEPGNRKILAYLRTYEDEIILCVANLARSAQPVELDLRAYKGYIPVELIGRAVFPPIGTLPYLLTLHGHGFYWFRLARGEEVPAWHEERLAPEELPLLVLFDGWRTLFRDKVVPWRAALADHVRKQFEREALPRFMHNQRWYGAKSRNIAWARLKVSCVWGRDREEWLLALVEVTDELGTVCCYFVPLSLLFENQRQERMEALTPFAIARVRRQADIGLVGDAMADPDFCRAMLQAAGNGEACNAGDGVVRWRWTAVADPSYVAHAEDFAVRPPSVQSSNSVVTLGGRLFLKCYRQLQEGINPEREMGQFLAEVAGFDRIVPIFAYMDYFDAAGQPTSLAILQPFVENQGDAWDYTVHYLEQYLDLAAAGHVEGEAEHGAYGAFIETLGRRTGELHVALAQTTGDPAFDPEPLRMADVQAWHVKVDADIDTTLGLLARHSEQLPPAGRDLAIFVASQGARLHQLLGEDMPRIIQGQRTRTHGDYHLGQVLVTQNDFVIIDFEGEPTSSFADRRRKYSPLRDVAGLLRSLNYAAYTASANVTTGPELAYGELSLAMRAWEEMAAGRFLSAYEGATAGLSLWPSFAEAKSWLRLLMLEKALYELRYEIEQRPQWVHVPLRGLADFIEEHRAREGRS
ncbi:MAG: putative maltokinase, partial [Gammaproteobacteria bacterium]|nr:putative maltokinase [Gammaproteobacteria bacterium]